MATGRGRLSSLDLVPEEGQEDVRWAYEQLNQRDTSAADILFQLNDRLTGKGLGEFKISKSAFNRKSVAIARAASRIKMSRDIFAGIADQLTPENIDKGNIALAEFIKSLIAEIISQAEDGGLSADEAMKLARGFQAVVLAQKQSTDRRSKAEKDEAARVEKTADALDVAAKEAGLSAETIARLRRDFLGMAA